MRGRSGDDRGRGRGKKDGEGWGCEGWREKWRCGGWREELGSEERREEWRCEGWERSGDKICMGGFVVIPALAVYDLTYSILARKPQEYHVQTHMFHTYLQKCAIHSNIREAAN